MKINLSLKDINNIACAVEYCELNILNSKCPEEIATSYVLEQMSLLIPQKFLKKIYGKIQHSSYIEFNIEIDPNEAYIIAKILQVLHPPPKKLLEKLENIYVKSFNNNPNQK